MLPASAGATAAKVLVCFFLYYAQKVRILLLTADFRETARSSAF
jgi:hypothetical protein